MAPSTSRALRSTNWRIRDSLESHTQHSEPIQSQSQLSQQKTDVRATEKNEHVPQHDSEHSSAMRPVASSTRVYVGNLPYIAQRDDVARIFTDAGLELANIDMSVDRFTNRNPSYCFVDLTSIEAARKALEILPGTRILDRPVRIKPCLEKIGGRIAARQLQLTRWGSSAFSPVESDVPSLLLPVQRQRRLIVSGMPKPADQPTFDAEIRQLFRGYAVEAVPKVKLPREDAHGTSKDVQYVFVDLESAVEAERAMSQLDGAQCWGGKVRVGMVLQPYDKIMERANWEGDDMV